MDNETIIEYLMARYNPDIVQEIARTLDLLEQLEVEDYNTTTVNLILTNSSIEPVVFFDMVLNSYREAMQSITVTLGLTIDPETNLRNYNNIIEAIMDMNGFVDLEEIAAYLESDEDSLDMTINLLSYFSTENVSDLMTVIHDADGRLVSKMRDKLAAHRKVNTETGILGNEGVDVKRCAKLVDIFNKMVFPIDTEISKLLADGLPYGLDFEMYASRLQSIIANSDPEDTVVYANSVAVELVTAVLASKQSGTDRVSALKSAYPMFFSDTELAAHLEARCQFYLNRLRNEETTIFS